MKKIVTLLFLLLFPMLAMAADGSLTFAPPITDMSVIFLGNVFGIVDGVLHGSGTQILGTIFGVFNSAVLALGGIIIMYTLIVSTVNTAHEGQMLGQKWSSMWVPVRATLGLALLIPKASGYCVMQIFMMWVVVQGVGAADKVWSAALDYLNRGGVIIQQQVNPITSIMGGGMTIANGAAKILYGQVCMLGLQTALTNQRQGYLNRKAKEEGPCYNPAAGSSIASFCENAVPEFITSVNAVTYQNNNLTKSTWELPMPNLSSGNGYDSLNGICGSISWKKLDATNLSGITTLTQSDLNTASLSRAIAIQQMYSDLQMIAQAMVNNDPQLNPPTTIISTNAPAPYAAYAQAPFGVPKSNSGNVCAPEKLNSANSSCTSWGGDGNAAPIFTGTEFQGAVSDYNAIMLPTLKLLTEAANSKNANQQRAFIQKANSDGWMLAGSYFFSLVNINSANSTTAGTSSTPTDDKSGLESSTFNLAPTQVCSVAMYSSLCSFFDNVDTPIIQVMDLINGGSQNVEQPNIPKAGESSISLTAKIGAASSTAYGFVENSLMVQLPGQAGQTTPTFVMNFIPDIGKPNISLPTMKFGCGNVKTFIFNFCFISYIGEAIYNYVFVPMFNFFLAAVTGVINTIVMAFLALPLAGIAQIFQYGVSYITQPNVNPIVALANMGVNYINYAADLWIYLLGISIGAMFLGPFGIVIMVVLALCLPLLTAWLGVMVSIGFTTAYFLPFLPYMIFTFGSIGWLMAVIEAMVAAPIVALGVTHPEGEGPFGKGEQAIMIILNIFLRPALMIIGYIAGIMLSYVCVWIINAGFSNVLPFIQGPGTGNGLFTGFNADLNFSSEALNTVGSKPAQVTTGYTSWAGIYAFFFGVLIYTTMYLTVVQKSFTLIATLPDKVLRWIGGQPESAGQDAAQWSEDSKKQVETGGEKTAKAQGQMGKQLGGYGKKAISGAKDGGPSSSGEGVE